MYRGGPAETRSRAFIVIIVIILFLLLEPNGLTNMRTLSGLYDELLNAKENCNHSYHCAVKSRLNYIAPPSLECTLRRYDYMISTVHYPKTRLHVAVTFSIRCAQPGCSLNRYLSLSDIEGWC